MKKIRIICQKRIKKRDNKLPVYFHGWLMNELDDVYSEELHKPELNSYTIHVEEESKIHFVITLLDNQSIDKISDIILDSDLQTFHLESSLQKDFKIIEKKVSELKPKELTDSFYKEEAKHTFDLKFISPTSFKSEGKYIFFPDLRLIIQSLMKKYNYIFEGNKNIDTELLEDLCQTTQIVSYRVFSSYHPIHRTFIPGFKGDIRVRCKGNQTLVNYLSMLFEFSNYSGIGMKTSMGMGAVSTKQVSKGEKNG